MKKEPKYVASNPVRGVVTLGGRQFGFALDAVSPKAVGYDRLYFDASGNGDLTRQRPVSATEVGDMMSESQFPRVNVALRVDGEPVEYAFLLSVRGPSVRRGFLRHRFVLLRGGPRGIPHAGQEADESGARGPQQQRPI